MQTPINAARDAMYTARDAMYAARDAMLLRNQQQSPLLRLPAELRNRIYELVLGGQEIRIVAPFGGTYPFAIKLRPISCQDNTTEDDVEMSDDTTMAATAPILPRWTRPQHFLALTAASWQLHKETALLPFGLNDFGGRYFSRFTSFLGSLQPQQRNAIAKVHVMIQDTFSLRYRTTSQSLMPDAITNGKMRSALRSLHGLECIVVEKWRDITQVMLHDSDVAVEKVEAMAQGRDVKVWVEMVAWGDA